MEGKKPKGNRKMFHLPDVVVVSQHTSAKMQENNEPQPSFKARIMPAVPA